MLVAGLLLAGVLVALYRQAPPTPAAPSAAGAAALSDLLGGEAAGFEHAIEPRALRFPRDLGAHSRYRSEWWYFTGNLTSADGRRFGFQLTFFRFALSADPPVRQSAWAANDIYMAHFALSDVAGGRFHAFERLSRGALDLAGVRAVPFRVWLDDWSVESTGGSIFPLQLSAERAGVSVSLTLEDGKPPVLQGEAGLSRKSAAPGNASYYFSYTRVPAHGEVRLPGVVYRVRGSAWMDREWSTSALGAEVVGWDWFALQLADGRDVMIYRLRRSDGGASAFSAGVVVDEQGGVSKLAATDFQATPLDVWESPASGARYPVRWRVRIPSRALDLEVAAYLPDQEFTGSVRYWEGTASVRGTEGTAAVSGEGYLEMTGYGAGRRALK